MLARDVMTTPVVSVQTSASVDDAAKLMLEKHISAIPVLDENGALAGILSEGDLLRRIEDGGGPRRSWWLELFSGTENLARDFVTSHSRRVTDVMTRDVATVDGDTPVGEIARLLETRRIKRVPVVADGKVAGIVSRSNLLQALARADASALPAPTEDDRQLRDAIADALTTVPGAQVNLINFIVEGGKVQIWGVADSDFEENAVRVAAENVPGVREVEVHMGRLPAWGYGI